MQFVTNGPEIPNAMLQSHEDGRLVFFCGAGISIPAGLPSFGGLVKSIYETIGTMRKGSEQDAFEAKKYDQALHLLEMRLPGGRRQMREALWDCLQLKSCTPKSLQTHKALLTLGRDRAGRLRLVTTNYDRLFFRAAGRGKPKVLHLAAPYFPPPQKDRWDGIVYLHGLLPVTRDDETALNSLIATSGDFGAAYLHEQRTSRFVSELMREYDICFIGYSLGDIILRYMFDAFAAIRQQSEANKTTCWAFVGDRDRSYQDWISQGVEPIFYNANYDHSLLHSTLQNWSQHYKDGLQSKEAIILQYASKPPDKGTQEDDFVGRVLWALSDKTGKPASQFAQLEPPPPLEWLLKAFFRENSPLAVLLADVDGAAKAIIQKLLPWVMKHTHDSRLLTWILQRSEQEQKLWRELFRCEELNKIGNDPSLNEEQKSYLQRVFAFFRDGLIVGRYTGISVVPSDEDEPALSACMRLRHDLTPRITIRMGVQGYTTTDEVNRKFIPFWPEISLAGDISLLTNSSYLERWRNHLPTLVEPLQQHLLDALDMLANLSPDAVNSRRDLSYFDLPSIAPHKQNQPHSGRAVLMHLLREAWDSLLQHDRPAAIRIAEGWFYKPYPTFKRFALYAAAQDNVIDTSRWVSWLRHDNGYCLWASETKREVCRLLVLQGHTLQEVLQDRLEEAILAGPTRDMWGIDISDDLYNDIKDERSCLLLRKISQDCILSPRATSFLRQLETKYPPSHAEEEQDEFSVWVGSPREMLSEEISLSSLPQESDEIAKWIQEGDLLSINRHFEWRQVCRERNQASLKALQHLVTQGIFPRDYWWEAIQIWTAEISRREFHDEILQWLLQLETDELSQLAGACSQWLVKCIEHQLVCESESLTTLCHRLIFLLGDTGIMRQTEDDDVVTAALNSPMGRTAQSLFLLWTHSGLSDGDGLKEPYRELFTKLCNRDTGTFRHAYVFFGRYAITLFRVDLKWTSETLLPLFDWARTETSAAACWGGFLWAARLYPDLLLGLWASFVACSEHFDKLGAMGDVYIQIALHIAIEQLDGFPPEEIREIFDRLPVESLSIVLTYLNNLVIQIPDKSRTSFVQDRVIPFLHDYWPKDRQSMTPEISHELALLFVASEQAFKNMWDMFNYSLGSVSNPHDILHYLVDSDICTHFPNESLFFLERICTKCDSFLKLPLGQCLSKLKDAEPQLMNNAIFIQLSSLIS